MTTAVMTEPEHGESRGQAVDTVPLKGRKAAVGDPRYRLPHRVRQELLKTAGIAFGAGMVIGAVTGAFCATTLLPKKALRL
jgi:hypothetical protein